MNKSFNYNNFLPQSRNKFQKFLAKNQLNTLFTVLVLFGLVMAVGSIGQQYELKNENLQSSVLAQSKALAGPQNMIDTMFGAGFANENEVNAMMDKQVKLITTRKAFFPALAVIKKHENTIRAHAKELGVPEDLALGIGFLENGGSEGAVSSAGATGVFQLMPGTARNLGLTVNGYTDERLIPEKNIKAGITYLSRNYNLFGDWGLTVWSYHAGEGNVAKALRIYAKANHGINLPGFDNAAAWKQYVQKHEITVHKLLSDKNVQVQLTNKLSDDSAGYPYKVMATAYIFDLSKQVPTEELIQRVTLLNTTNMDINEFFNS